jgi:hypothetical protein
VAGSCGCVDESSGSGTTELVTYLKKLMLNSMMYRTAL